MFLEDLGFRTISRAEIPKLVVTPLKEAPVEHSRGHGPCAASIAHENSLKKKKGGIIAALESSSDTARLERLEQM